MPKIDKFLQQMVNKGATVLRLDPGDSPVVEVAGGHRITISPQELLGTVLDGLTKEILPEALGTPYLRGEKVNFDYTYEGMRFQFLVCRSNLGTRIVAARFGGTAEAGAGSSPAALDSLDPLIMKLLAGGGSDLYLTVDEPPLVRMGGVVEAIGDYGDLPAARLQELVQSWVPPKLWEAFLGGQDTEFARLDPALPCRLRVSLFQDYAGPSIAVRVIPREVPDPESLGVPETVRRLASLNRGLVILAGPMGSGKSTTLASLLNIANATRKGYVVTIQDSIEFEFPEGSCLIRQREVGCDPVRQKRAIRAALRQAPDILAVGEIRDGQTLELAIQAVQTGRMVLATLSTASQEETLSTLAGYFPQDHRRRVLAKLSECLTAILGHTLLPKIGGGQVVAMETLFNNPGIAALIRGDKCSQLAPAMKQSRYGQVSHNEALVALIEARKVDPMEAYLRCHDRESFIAACQKAEISFDPRGAGQLVTEV
jgi:twitching motility protein PilT